MRGLEITKKKRGQKRIDFHLERQYFLPKDYVPTEHFSVEDEMKSGLVKKGYLVWEIKREEGFVRFSVTCARANLPLKKRLKLQEKIDRRGFKDKTIKHE